MNQKAIKEVETTMPVKVHERITYYTDTMIPTIIQYINSSNYPTIKGLCVRLNLSDDRLMKARQTKGNEALQRLISLLKNKQEDYLVQAGLQNRINPIMAIFLLKAAHGYVETSRQEVNVKSVNISIKDYAPSKKGIPSDTASII